MADETVTTALVIDTTQADAAIAGTEARIENLGKATEAEQRKIQKAFASTQTAAQKLDAQIADLEASTSDAAKETDEYKAALAALEAKGLKLAEEATKRLAREQEKLAKDALKASAEGFDRAGKRADAMAKTFEALNIPGASFFKRTKDLNESLKQMTESGSAADVKLLRMTQTIGMVAGPAAVAAAAIVGVGVAAAAVITQTRDWNEELERVGLGLDQSIITRADATVASMGAMELAMKSLAATAADTLSPVLQATSTRATSFALAFTDALKELKAGNYGAAISAVALSYTTQEYVKKAEELARVQEDVNEYTREYKRELDPLLKQIMATEEAERKAAATRRKSAQEAAALRARVTGMAEGRDTPAQLQQVKTSWDGVNQSILGATVSAAKFAEAEARGAAEGEKRAEASRRNAEAVRDAYAAAAMSIAGSAERAFGMWAQAEQQQVADSADRIRSLQEQLAAATSESEKRQLEARIATLKKKQAEDLKAAKLANALQKSAAVLAIGVNTAVGIIKAYAMNPLPSPIGIASAIAMGLAGAVEIAAVLATPDPSYAGSTGVSPPVPSAGGSKAASLTAAAQASGPTGGMTQGAAPAPVMAAPVASPRYEAPVAMSDGYVAPSSKGMTVKAAPGDVGVFTRSGPLGGLKADPALLALQTQTNVLLEDLAQAYRDMTTTLLYQQHKNAVAPPPGRA